MPPCISDYFKKHIRKIGFFGIGKSCLALLDYLPLSGVDVILRSDVPIEREKIPKHIKISEIYEGARAAKNIHEDALIFSPSVRRDRPDFLRAERRGVIFSSDTELFFEWAHGDIFAISGSDGKSSTAKITAELLSGGNSTVLPIGNFGAPLLPSISDDARAYVVELSSFNLFYLKADIGRAALTNITPNHLNWHSSFAEYRDTKLSLIKMAREGVISFDDAELRHEFMGKSIFSSVSDTLDYHELKMLSKSEVYITRDKDFIYRNGEKILEVEKIKRREPYNIKNLMTAIALTDGFIEKEDILRVAESFSGLRHRARLVLSSGGVDYIDSSIDTTPSRTVTTLSALSRKVIIILGGRGKDVGYEALVPLLKSYAKYAIVTGEDREKIAECIRDEVKTLVISDFDEAVILARTLAVAGDAVLLSPAATSYDAFSDYQARGNRFEEIITKYSKKNKNDA